MTTPEVGLPAPDFTLRDQHGEAVTLSEVTASGRAVLIVFFPFAFSGTCTDELCEIRDDLDVFENDDVQVLGISCDSFHSLRTWGDQEGYKFPLLSDFWPHGEVTRRYGAMFEDKGFATRATFLVDRAGVLRWSLLHGPGEARDPQSYREALAAL